jgi:hypothetical protein
MQVRLSMDVVRLMAETWANRFIAAPVRVHDVTFQTGCCLGEDPHLVIELEKGVVE